MCRRTTKTKQCIHRPYTAIHNVKKTDGIINFNTLLYYIILFHQYYISSTENVLFCSTQHFYQFVFHSEITVILKLWWWVRKQAWERSAQFISKESYTQWNPIFVFIHDHKHISIHTQFCWIYNNLCKLYFIS